jgi:hypothetical protein
MQYKKSQNQKSVLRRNAIFKRPLCFVCLPADVVSSSLFYYGRGVVLTFRVWGSLLESAGDGKRRYDVDMSMS